LRAGAQPIEDGKIRVRRPLENDPLPGRVARQLHHPPRDRGRRHFYRQCRETPDKESAFGVVFAPEVSVVSEDERYRFEAVRAAK
jgi:hypothetical protein